MKNLTIFLLCISLILCGFTCDNQLNELIPTETDTPAGMVLIPAGEVQIGLSQTQLDRHNQQYHHATLQAFTVQRKPHLPATALPEQTFYTDAFYMDIHEVTWGQYLDFMEASGYESKSVTERLQHWDIDKDLPITQLTITDMQAYADFYGKQIPTETEWEKAARGGLKDASYSWGNNIEPTHCNYNHAGHLNAMGTNGEWVLYFSKAGKYAPNGYGLYDMAGNVSEYVVTEWDANPHGMDQVITRGGNYRGPGYEQQVWYRNYHTTGLYTGTVGFRCVKRFSKSP